MNCVDNHTAMQLFDRELDDRQSAAIHRHAAECARCRALLASVARPQPTPELFDERFMARLERRLTSRWMLGRIPFSERTQLAKGELLGKYIVIQRRGAGGLGTIYEAFDPEREERLVLKLIQPSGAPEEQSRAAARIIATARALARLSHPNVLRIHEAGPIGDRVYVASEFVKGVALTTLRQQPWQDLLELFVQAGRGLAAAHQAGVLHLGFNTDSCLVGMEGQVRVLDFGVVAALAEADLAGQDATAPPEVPGFDESFVSEDSFIGFLPERPPTSRSEGERLAVFSAPPADLGQGCYMAPEQLRGEPESPATDQFCFCAALYHALYRVAPFQGGTLAEWAHEILHGSVSAPPQGSPVPQRIHDILLHGLALRPGARYPSMKELLEDLTGEHTVTVQRRRPKLALGLVSLATLACAVALAIAFIPEPSSEKTIVSPSCGDRAKETVARVWDSARRQRLEETLVKREPKAGRDRFAAIARAADRHADEWRRAFERTCDDGGADRAAVEACLERRLDRFGEALAFAGEGGARSLDHVGHALAWLRSAAECNAPGGEAVLATADRTALASLDRRLGEATRQVILGETDAAMAALGEIAADAREAGLATAEADARHQLGLVHLAAGNLVEAREHWRRAAWTAHGAGYDRLALRSAGELLASATSAEERAHWRDYARAGLARLGQPAGLAAELLHREAIATHRSGDAGESRRLEEQALHSWRESGSLSGTIDSRRNLAASLLALGRVSLAISTLREALRSSEELHGRHAAGTLAIQAELAGMLVDTGNFDEAASVLEAASRTLDELEQRDPLVEGELSLVSGRLSGARGDRQAATASLRQAVRELESGGGPLHPLLAPALIELGDQLLASRAAEEAMSAFRQAEGIVESRGALDRPLLYRAQVGALRAKLAIDGAASTLEEAIVLEKRVRAELGPRHPVTAEARQLLGSCYGRLRQLERAIAEYRAAIATWNEVMGEGNWRIIESLASLGELYLARDEFSSATRHLELALAILDRSSLGRQRARIQFALAQALWPRHGDRERSVELALQASATYAGEGQADREREVVSWLRGRGGSRRR